MAQSLRRSHKYKPLQTHPQQQQQPWRGHINPSNNSLGFGPSPQMGPPAPPPLQQQTYRDQSQVCKVIFFLEGRGDFFS